MVETPYTQPAVVAKPRYNPRISSFDHGSSGTLLKSLESLAGHSSASFAQSFTATPNLGDTLKPGLQAEGRL